MSETEEGKKEVAADPVRETPQCYAYPLLIHPTVNIKAHHLIQRCKPKTQESSS